MRKRSYSTSVTNRHVVQCYSYGVIELFSERLQIKQLEEQLEDEHTEKTSAVKVSACSLRFFFFHI